MESVDIVIVGAGVSGLRAAKHLKKQGISNIKVLEARNRVGGRTWSEHVKGIEGAYVDLGGQWFAPENLQKHAHELIKEYKLKLNPQFDEGKNVLELVGSNYIYQGNISNLAMFAKPKDVKNNNNTEQEEKPELDRIWALLDKMCKEVDAANPEKHPKAKEWDNMTMSEWTKENVKSESTRRLVNWFIAVCLAVEPSEISVLYFLTFLSSGGGYDNMVNIHGGAQQDTIVGGSQQLSTNMQKELDGSKPGSIVQLDSAVTAIDQNKPDAVIVTVRNTKTNATKQLKCKRVIIALPPPMILKIHFSPALPHTKEHLYQRMPMGQVIKFNILYKKAFWREQGFSGELISDMGPLALSYDKHYKDMHGLVGFIAGAEARKWSRKTPAERKKCILQQLQRVFKTDEALHPLHFIEQDFASEEFSRGCYFAVMNPGTQCELGKELRTPFGKLFFAGAETATVWLGYIDGAMEAGIRAADEVKKSLTQAKL